MPSFINADLEITSDQELIPISEAWGDKVLELCCQWQDGETFLACFEINSGEEVDEPEPLVRRFCELINALPQNLRRLLDSSKRSVIDLGYQSDDGGISIRSRISAEVLGLVSELGLELAITVYPLEGKLVESSVSIE